MMDEQTDWIDQIKARGFGDLMGVTLDALEPLGPLGAQLLWVFQPLSGVLGWHKAVDQIARALEEPGGIDTLRQRLRDDSD
jgi:hypothetical protein